jgi:hypothetical protein
MIQIVREDGVEVKVEVSNDPEAVEHLLNHVLNPDTLVFLRERLNRGGEEIFFEFTGVNKKEFPLVRYHLVHLDTHSREESLSRGNFYAIFYIHKDSIAIAEAMAKTLKRRFKDANDWNDTNEAGIKADEFFRIPPMDLS